MTQLFGYNTHEDSKMLFSDIFQEQSSGLTTEFTPKALRVGSYSGSDTDRQFQSFPTPPDSPVLAELTAPCKNQQAKLQHQQHQQLNSAAVEAFSHVQNAGFFCGNGSCLTGGCGDDMDMGDLSLLEDLLLVADPLQMGEHQYSYNTIHTGSDSLHKSDFGDGFGQLTPDSTLSSSFFPSSFTDALDDCNIPSPTPSSPSPITIADIFSGDLPNLDNLTLGMELAPMEQQQCQQQQQQQRPKLGLFGMGSSGEDSDNGSEHSFYSLPLDELQPSTFHPMNVHQMPSSVLTHPPPLYHEHHHNIQSYNQYNNNNHQQQHNHHQQQSQSRSPYAQQNSHHHMFNAAVQGMSERTHNYQCRTMHTTLKMLDGQGEGLLAQEITPPDQRSCAGPIRKPCRARPRKQSVTSSDEGCSDEEHVVSTTSGTGRTTPNRNRGRGRREAMKGNHLWEFIRDLLKSDSYCPKFIRWEDRESGVFRFVNSEAVATMWGRKKNNPQMTYEKLSRAMRYYYKREILERVDGRRLVYKFGKNAEGWREAAGLQ